MKALRDLLTTPATELGRMGRFVSRQYRILFHCLRLLDKNHATQLAAALSYYTIFGLVPLAIVVVLIFHSTPAYRQTGEAIKSIVYSELRLTTIEYPNPDNPQERFVLTDYLDQIIDRFFANMDKGSLGVVSAVLVIWAALRLLSIIESAFNHMWYVPQGRRFLHRMINYWALLTLVPLLLSAGLYATTKYTILERFRTSVLGAISPVISYVLSMLSLFLLYLVMPNAKVKAGAAIQGAAVAALIWSVARWGFGIYVTQLIPYSTIYGVLGLIPLGVFWIYITWMIVLFGLQMAFTIQHLDTLETAEAPQAQEAEGRFIASEITAIAVVREIALAFEDDRGPVSTDDLCSRLDIPGEFGQRLLDQLVDKGLLASTSKPAQGFTLARDPRRIRLSDIAEAVDAASFGQPKPQEHDSLSQVAQAQRDLLSQHSLGDILNSSIPAIKPPQANDGLPPQNDSQSR